MSARQAKNEASMGKMQPRKIDDLVNTEIETNNNTKNNVNVAVNNETNDATNIETEKEINTNTNVEVDRIKALKEKMKKDRQKQSNKQVTVYLTPENYKRFNKLKAKGEKSDLINQLLDMYFED